MNKNQLTQLISLLLFSFITLMAIRLTLYNFYSYDFQDLTTMEFYASLFMGIRVDMITLFTFSSIFILSLLVIKNEKIRSKIALLWAVVLNIIFILSFSDVLYYDFIHRHISNEIFNLGDDMDIIFDMAFGSMLLYTLGATLLSTLFLYLVHKIFSNKLESFISGKKLIGVSIAVVLILKFSKSPPVKFPFSYFRIFGRTHIYHEKTIMNRIKGI